MAREFTELLFLGSGDCSKARAMRLAARLEEGLVLSSGLQQPPMSTDPPLTREQKDTINEMADELRDVVRDIAKALLGIEVEIPSAYKW